MDSAGFRESAHAAIEQIIEYFESLPSLRVTPSVQPGWLGPQLPPSAPDKPESFASITKDITSKIIPGLTHWQSPNFMAFFPAHTTFPSIIGELYSAAFSAPAFNWLCSPVCTELETHMMDWMAGVLGLPECFLSTNGIGGGVIQGSASEATVAVMIAARDRMLLSLLQAEGLIAREDETEDELLKREDRAAEIRGKLVALAGDSSHSSAQKAANICGVRYRSIATPSKTGFTLTGQAVEGKLQSLKDQGLIPFYIQTMYGSTGTCAVDPFNDIVDACEKVMGKDQVWVHVDGAYAGAALCCEEFRPLAAGFDRVDSFDMNMHKWMLVNFDASCLFLRNRVPLITAMSISRSYLVNPSTLTGRVTDYRDWQIPLGRRFRALKIWLVLRTYGVEAIQKMIRKHVALGELFAELIKSRTDLFEVVSGPAFALTVIRCVLNKSDTQTNGVVDSGKHAENRQDEMNGFGTEAADAARAAVKDKENALTKQVYDLINSRGELFLTSAVVEGTYVIRVVNANELASEESIRHAFDVFIKTTEEVRAAQGI